MSRLASFLLKTTSRPAARRFGRAVEDARAAQLARLRRILRANAGTEYGIEHGFVDIRDFEAWRRRVPIVTYEELRESMQRILSGESNVLTAEDPVMFARTSGTTGDAKFIPVTPTCQGREHQDQMRTWFWHAMRDHPTIFHGKVVSLVSPAVEGHAPSGLPYGSTSGHIYKHMPQVVKSTYLLPYEVFELEDYETKYYAIMRLGLGAPDVSFLGTANPSSIMKLVETADGESERLIRDVHDGGFDPRLDLPLSLRNRIEPRLPADPERARELERLRAARGGRLIPHDYWPRLALVGCWKGGTVGSHLGRFPQWFGPEGGGVAVRDWGYLSSEARGSIPLSDLGAGGVLTVGSTVFEFVPVAEVEAAPERPSSWNCLLAHELEAEAEYYVLLTTTGGLYRYDINDVVRVVGRFRGTPIIQFQRKGRGVTSLTGEKVSVTQIIEAFEKSGAEVGVHIDHFKAEAEPQAARYVFLVESRAGLAPERRLPLLRALEARLQALNLEYAAKRASGRLRAPVLRVMRPGWYEARKRRMVARGQRAFQAKTIILSTRKKEKAPDEIEAEVFLDE